MIPYVGNGYFGLEIANTAPIYVKYGRYLSKAINYHPVVEFEYQDDTESDFDDGKNGKQAFVVDYVNGVAHKFQCFGNDFFISNDFYGINSFFLLFLSNFNIKVWISFVSLAHRILPQVFVQEVKLTNMRNTPFSINVITSGLGDWQKSQTKYIK